MNSIIDIENLSRHYNRVHALDSVSIAIPRGGVFGLVGENGAGKSTLIHHILGLLRAQKGTVRVFGVDPVRNPASVLGRMGIVTEDRDLPDWMRVDELMQFTSTFYPKWDKKYAEELRHLFGLAADARIGTLSRGQLAKASLLAALAHRPELLVLDEPSSGLDPVVRRDILEAIIATAGEDGRTVLFSSHLLDEVERVADRVAMMRSGRLVLNMPLEELKDTHHRLIVRAKNGARAIDFPGILVQQGEGPERTVLCSGEMNVLVHAITTAGFEVVHADVPSLNEIFVARCAAPAVAVKEA
ncbi:MAG: ABC transporter ATP-binding protein [Candidatus Hydrogenedentota bacterium]